MTYVEAPQEWDGQGRSVFLAGGITGCPDWQQQARTLLERELVVLNPRRKDFPIDDPAAAPAQIAWEFRHLHAASLILFWFPRAETSVQPIALYELGRHIALNARVVVGCDPAYQRLQDVHEQLKHARPRLRVRESLKDTCRAAIHVKRICEACDDVEADPSALDRTVIPVAGLVWPQVEADMNEEYRRRGSHTVV